MVCNKTPGDVVSISPLLDERHGASALTPPGFFPTTMNMSNATGEKGHEEPNDYYFIIRRRMKGRDCHMSLVDVFRDCPR